jgi:two-component system OmpR family sensor kinase/two-component system sensor histidine kinase BaeS
MSKRHGWQQEPNQEIEIPLEVRPSHMQWHGHKGAHPWVEHRWQRNPKRRVMFVRMATSLAIMLLLVGGGVALVSHLWSSYGRTDSPPLFYYVWRICGLAILLPMLLAFIGRRIFRSYAQPLADIMDAADEVASGNLQVRVRERGSREFQQLATAFNRMTEELARVDQQRRNLTADVAHELRTPLHIIQGNLEGILDGVYAPTPEHVEATLQETRTLARLVDDLRTLSLAESGQLPLHPETIDVHDLLADVATSFGPQAESAGIDLRVQNGEATGNENGTTQPLTLYADPGRLDQVLSNLVNNALRHTPSGGRITLGATMAQNGADHQNDPAQIQIVVADNGEGIPPDDLPFIFDRFWRGDRARTHQEGTGSGLGLAITGQLVKAHGGTITVDSAPGSGTTFTITLPVAPPQDRNDSFL